MLRIGGYSKCCHKCLSSHWQFLYVHSDVLPLYKILKKSNNWLWRSSISKIWGIQKMSSRRQLSLGVNLIIDNLFYVASDTSSLYHLCINQLIMLFYSQCTICSRWFSTQFNMQMHIKGVHERVRYPCNICGKGFTRASLRRHQRRIHSVETATLGNAKASQVENVWNHHILWHFRRHWMTIKRLLR